MSKFFILVFILVIANAQAIAKARENSPLFDKNLVVSESLIRQRLKIVLPKVQTLIGRMRPLQGSEVILDASPSIREAFPPGSAAKTLTLSLRNPATGKSGVLNDSLIAVGNAIIFSFPGDDNHTNTVFEFNGAILVNEKPLALFVIESMKEPWVTLSRAMGREEAESWYAGEIAPLASQGSDYSGYGGRVYHFQLGLENVYVRKDSVLVEYEADKAHLIALWKKGQLWSSVNQSNIGVHGPLFEIVVKADALTDAGLSVK